ncbi:hypothetical protein CEXT_723861 [Caerostris extrusa]|uniref:Uncharacterized protein n=1 Tax=Caerostris extrusa TaxID=172846 RepID=A0AAV4M3T7_CAEEX|nr:hypothetical protein CEXT_723861 [Caerostris extrusa]
MLRECRFCEKSIAVATRDVNQRRFPMHTSLPLEVVEGDGAEFVPSCKYWPFPLKDVAECRFVARNHWLLLPERCQNPAVGPMHNFFALLSVGKGDGAEFVPSCKNVGRSLLKDVAECRFFARNRLLLLPEM